MLVGVVRQTTPHRIAGALPDITDGNTVNGGKDSWSGYSTCPTGYVAMSPQYIDLHGTGASTNVNHFECSITGCKVWI